MALTRRDLLRLVPASLLAASNDRGRDFPSEFKRYADPATEFPVVRLTDPAHTCLLPAFTCRSVARHGGFLIYSSDRGGTFQAFRVDTKTGENRQLTDVGELDPAKLTLLPGDHSFCYFDGNSLMQASISSLRSRQIYQVPEGYEPGDGFSVSGDALYAALVERGKDQFRLRLIDMAKGTAGTLVESPDAITNPIPRPRRASVLYVRGGYSLWLVHYDRQQNYRLRVAPGGLGQALWSPDGRSVLYLNVPDDRSRLNNLRELVPDTNEERMLAATSQFVAFGVNGDATVFIGSSGSKASPYVLILVRAVKRELTLSEHRASDPVRVAPIFSPESRRVYFQSDRHGKFAIYTMSVERLVDETDN